MTRPSSPAPDAQAVASVSEAHKRRIGRLAYVVAALSLVHKWPRKKLRIDTGTQQFEAEALFVLRGRHYAGPWSLDSGARLGHEKLRVLALPHARRRDVVRLIGYVLAGTRRPDPRWRFIETDWLSADCDESQSVQADGDSVARTPALFELSAATVAFV